ncbi:hypothetical protein [Methylobacterium sp. Leaf89]|uniref:hypothetical protein n=1 Tax=Methylobacterium sp. Leaf89 TaxID=1736245 RepID=UPI00138ED80B|nr:hypothetical protein [Methylobacterium sp. Leaf89]
MFDTTQTNVLRPDPVNPLVFQAAVGEAQARGAEPEAVANLGPGFNILAAYSHVDIRTTRSLGSPETVGLALSGIPGNPLKMRATSALSPES